MKINNILNFTKASTLSVGIAICVAVSAPIYAAELKVQVQSDFGQLDPAFWASQSDRNIIHAIYPKLIEFKSSKTWEWQLSSAESIEQIDDLTIKFTLKPGLMWTNGYGEVTAEDVEYSFILCTPAIPLSSIRKRNRSRTETVWTRSRVSISSMA